MLTADILIDMHDAAANGTTLTTAIMANAARGETAGFDAVPTPATGMTIDATQKSMLDSVSVGTLPAAYTIYPPSHASRVIQYDNTVAGPIYTLLWLDTLSSGTHTAVSIGGWFKTTVPNSGGAAMLYDFWCIFNAVGDSYAAFQLLNGTAPVSGGYGVNIETLAPGTTHSAYLAISPNTIYWVTMFADFVTGTMKMNIYDTNSTLVGAIVSTGNVTGSFCNTIRFGNNEIGNQGGVTWFENILVDYSFATFPLGPMSPPLLAPIRRGNRLRRRFVAQVD